MLRRVHLHGSLKAKQDSLIEIEGGTVFEVLEGLSRQMPLTTNGRHRIQVVGYTTEHSLHESLGETVDLHLVPQFSGGKNGGLGQILIGALLIGISLIPGVGVKIASLLLKMGAMQVLGGVAQMLAPTPEDDTNLDSSKYLGSPKNTTKIGTRIPILYGEFRTGGHILSFDINALEFRGTGAGGGSGGK